MIKSTSLTWDLEPIFSGGSTSAELQTFVEQLRTELNQLETDIQTHGTPASPEEAGDWTASYLKLQRAASKLEEARSFVNAVISADVNDEYAKQWQASLKQTSTKISALITTMEAQILQMDDRTWQAVLEHPDTAGLTFPLEEQRTKAKEKMDAEAEQLASSLAQDGYAGWSEMYNTLVGRMKIPWNGENLSVGQAQNQMETSDRTVRENMHKAWEEAWDEQGSVFAETLNHLAGFRLNLYEKRGWTNVLKEPLMINRMEEKTLDAMWEAIEELKPKLLPFMDEKARLIGVDALAWHDVHAPLGEIEQIVPFDEAAEAITAQFREVSPKLADFTKHAFENHWIEAEDRPGKRPGGFCTRFPETGETRIFMTYGGTPSNVQTLAHELGHAYHQEAMQGVSYFSTRYAMNVAETASTFAEQIVAESAVNEAENEAEKLALLNTKISRGLAFFMNLHARFLFEKRFYEQRKNGWLTADQLNHLMQEAQEEAYCGQLASYSPTFWSSKLHFHMTGVPFYNFPYTFGYLFSLGIYQRAKEEGPAFEDQYIALLRDTASMPVEELAWKHLHADITKKEFWKEAAAPLLEDVEQFLQLSQKQ
ncbi:pepF/M3 family oligoendopeptidase [Salsuginibacillus halophilus]|uniref:PepF/M3 family oligoendopeptidase n=1 Tax=Salsuginibacillus halophilus TaxID=517424 RepID=A0A2P8HI66_9BACI|nr:M3 family oligoendopeptidase [Salsuginibacillus halophilus]PSL45897.1 pepF/M3 family oligoendopeptidase [Salsuginibacillus halophilus]